MLSRLLFNPPSLLPVALLGCVAALGLTLWLYRDAATRLPRPWAWVVPGLRGAAVLAVAVALFRPTIVRPKEPSERGAVVVLVDRSMSMGVIDATRPVSRRVALAEALGLLPQGLRPQPVAQLDRIADQLGPTLDTLATARGELDYARLAGRDEARAAARADEAASALLELTDRCASLAADGPASHLAERFREIARLVKQSPDNWLRAARDRIERLDTALAAVQTAADEQLFRADPAVREACTILQELSRLDLSLMALRHGGRGLLDRLDPRVPVQVYTFADTLDALPLARMREGPSTRPSLQALGRQTDIAAALAQARALAQAPAGGGVAAIVLFSDGRQTNPVEPRAGGAGAVPVFTIPAAAPLRRDLSITRVNVPSSAFVGEAIDIPVEIATPGAAGETVQVIVEADGHRQAASVPVSGERATARLTTRLDAPGLRTIDVRVTPVPAELSEANNRVSRTVKVLAEKTKVLLLTSTPGWDYQYLRNALSRSGWAELTDRILPGGAELPLSVEQVLAQDVVVLVDVAPASLRADQWDAVSRLATERGGGVLIVAGEAHLPTEADQQPLLAPLLPWASSAPPGWRGWPGEEPAFRFQPTPPAEESSVLRLADDPAENRHHWGALPAVFRFVSLGELKPGVRPLLVERETGAAVVTEHRAGVGRALFVGINETWRWRRRVGERDQDRFWLQLVRYAAEAPYAAHAGNLSLDADPVVAEPRQPLRVRARLLDDRRLPLPTPASVLQVLRHGNIVQTRPMAPLVAGVQTGRYETVLADLDAGEYELRLQDVAGSSPSVQVAVRATTENELADLAGDEANLRRIAEATGGELVKFEQVASLPGRLLAARERLPRLVEYPLWSSPYLFLFVLGCLGAEWGLRKRFGLP